MSAATKPKASHGTMDVVKTEDRMDTIIRQAIGREPFVSFPRATDSRVQLTQLIHALDQQGVSNSFSGSNICAFLFQISFNFVMHWTFIWIKIL